MRSLPKIEHVVILALFLLLVACGLSGQFRHDATYAYSLLVAAKDGKPVRESDFVQAMAKAKASAKSSEDNTVVEKLDDLGILIKNIDARDKLERALFDSCAREVSYRLGLDSKSQTALCDKLGELRTERDRVIGHCTEANPTVKKLYGERLQIDVAKRPKEWLSISDKLSARSRVVEEECRRRVVPEYERKLPALLLGQ